MNLSQLDSTTIITPCITFAIVYRQSVDSTNNIAYELARQGVPEGTLVVADTQQRGRGRLGRAWLSPASKNIYASLILRPALAPRYASQLSIVEGLAVYEALSGYLPNVSLKWPNDVLSSDKKSAASLPK